MAAGIPYFLSKEGDIPMKAGVTHRDIKRCCLRIKHSLILKYLGIWVFALVFFWWIMDPGDALGYSILFLWIIFPITTFVVSLSVGKKEYSPWKKWLLPLILGFMYMLSDYLTFKTANMLAFDKFNAPGMEYFVAGVIISVIGLILGIIFSRLKRTY